MAERKLTLIEGDAEFSIGDFDSDKEAEISLTGRNGFLQSFYLNRANLCSLRNHIEYLLAKT